MVTTAAPLNAVSRDVEAIFERDFGRVFKPSRRLLELRDLKACNDKDSDYWTATALWTFPEIEPETPPVTPDTNSAKSTLQGAIS